MLESKIENLIKYSLETFSSKDVTNSLVSARKCGEVFCRTIIYHHYGSEKGKEVCFNSYEKRSKSLKELIETVTHYKYKNKIILEGRGLREFIERYLRVLIYNGNNSAHDFDNSIEMTHNDVKIVQFTVKRLLYWLFIDYLKCEIPSQLVSYIEKYDIFIESNYANKEWVKTLVQNLQAQNYKVFLTDMELSGGENPKKRVKQAIDTAETAILIYTDNKNDKSWFDEQHGWMKKRKQGHSKFKTIPISVDKDEREDIYVIDFSSSADYIQSFCNLIKSIERKSPNSSINIDINKIKIPHTDAVITPYISIRKSYLLIFMLVFSLYSAMLIYVKLPIESSGDNFVQGDFNSSKSYIDPKNKKD